MPGGRKGYGQELNLIHRYSELSTIYFDFIKNKLEFGDEEEKWKAVNVLKGAFEKMIPQKLDGEFTNTNLNTSVDCTPEEQEAVRKAILASVQNIGGKE